MPSPCAYVVDAMPHVDTMPTPGPTRSTYGPCVENDAIELLCVDAPTAIAPATFAEYAAGYMTGSTVAGNEPHVVSPQLPAAITIVTPFPDAYCIAWSSVEDGLVPPRLRLITLAPWSAAQVMPASTALYVPLPLWSSTRTGRMRTPGAAPEIPLPLTGSAAMMPATNVPWPLASTPPSPPAGFTKSQPDSTRPSSRSSWVRSTPLSTTATVTPTPVPPGDAVHVGSNGIRSSAHCDAR